jgi:hypothetical protein
MMSLMSMTPNATDVARALGGNTLHSVEQFVARHQRVTSGR